MKRYTLLVMTLFLAISSCLLAADKPNIVMFLIDDQDLDQLEPYGGKTHTPNLSRMAQEGIQFTRAFVSSTVCTPSRYTFLTGRYAGAAYDKSYLAECPKGQQGHIAFNMGLEEDNMNVGAVLAANGYATGFVGKYHAHGSESTKADHGTGILPHDKEAKDNRRTSELFRKNELAYRQEIKKRGFTWARHIYWGNMISPYSKHNPEWTMKAAVEFIEEHKDQPFYLHYCTTLLHGPNASWFKSMSSPDMTGQGNVKAEPRVMAQRNRLVKILEEKGLDPKEHFGLAWIDANLGTLLAKLKELGLEDNTLVVFAPDHGSSDKGSVYARNGTRIPLLMRWPSVIPTGIKSQEMVQNIDMVPTFFDVAGAEVPAAYRMHGMSLRPLFKDGKAPEGKWRDFLYFEMGCARAVMTDQWKYIAMRYTQERLAAIEDAGPRALPRYLSPLGRMGIGVRGAKHPGFWSEDQLYNISQDAGEMKNLAAIAEYEPKLNEMKARLQNVLKTFDRPFGEFVEGGNAAPPGSVEEQLKTVRRIKIQGKKVILPSDLKGKEKDGGKGKRKKKK